MLTQERLREALSYDPETGIFRWASRMGRKGVVGRVAGSHEKSRGYIGIRIDGKRYKAHRLAVLFVTGEWPPEEVDHINGVKTDNRWQNLRLATGLENQRNKGLRRNNSSGVSGVSWDQKSTKWRTYIDRGGKTTFLGYFADFDHAVKVRIAAELDVFGSFSPAISRAAEVPA